MDIGSYEHWVLDRHWVIWTLVNMDFFGQMYTGSSRYIGSCRDIAHRSHGFHKGCKHFIWMRVRDLILIKVPLVCVSVCVKHFL